MNTSEYQKFEDFIFDESFYEYVAGSNESSMLYWDKWIKNHPEKAEDFQKATHIIRTLTHTRKIEVGVDKHESLQEMLSHIDEFELRSSSLRRFILPLWVRVAAMLVLSVGLAWVWNKTYTRFKAKETIVYNEIIVPIGEKSQVILSDGSHVWINSGSRFKYPVHFGEQSRDVFLTGEAFFDVTKQNKQLFVVNTQDSKVEVLGTAFNVKAYPEDAKTQTTVARGLVSVKSLLSNEKAVLVRPNQMAEIKKIPTSDRKLYGSSVEELKIKNCKNVEAVTCWKDQLLVFNNEPLGDMALKMERWFNVKISIEDAGLKQERFNGKFVHNETVYQVLEAIRHTTPIRYTAVDNEIRISLNK